MVTKPEGHSGGLRGREIFGRINCLLAWFCYYEIWSDCLYAGVAYI